MKKNIIWIASYPKSGNTWFRIFMENYYSNEKEPISINDLGKTRIASSRELFDKYSSINSSDLTTVEINNLRPEVYKMISADHEEDVFLKVHDMWQVNSEGKSIFPNTISKGVIYLIRNPLDVVVSNMYHNSSTIEKAIQNLNDPKYSLASNPDKLHTQLPQMLSSWSQHVESWVEKSSLPIHVIKYEDLKKNPIREFQNALRFLNLELKIKKIEQAAINSSLEIVQNQEMKDGFKEKPIKASLFFRRGEINSWKSEIPVHFIEDFIESNKMVMMRYNYM